MSLAGLSSNDLRHQKKNPRQQLSCGSTAAQLTLQCSHLFFTELCTFIPLVCCIDPPSVRLVVAVQALLKTECTQLRAEAV